MKKYIRNKTLIFPMIIMAIFPLGKSFAQNVGVNATGSFPNTLAGLDINFSNKGLLIPRVSLTSTTNVTTIATPATSLLVYNTNAAMTGGAFGYWYYDGTQWVQFTIGSSWLLLGNTGTTVDTNFLDTTDKKALDIRTNNIIHTRIITNGQIEILNTGQSVFI